MYLSVGIMTNVLGRVSRIKMRRAFKGLRLTVWQAMTWALKGRMKSLPPITGVALARRIISFGRKYGFRRR
jgi:hypothetical protein